MKYLITESKFDSIVFKYLDNQDFENKLGIKSINVEVASPIVGY